jgi:hypothetical protein
MATYDWETQPEAAGAVTAFTADSTGMRWPEELGPVRAGPGEVTQGHAEMVFLPDADEREARRHQDALDYDSAAHALRATFTSAARSAGADQLTARRTADALLERVPAAAPGISEQAMEQLLDAVEKAVSQALAGTVPKPRRPHRRVNPLPDHPEPGQPAAGAPDGAQTETPEAS